jgi:hypothetical protein
MDPKPDHGETSYQGCGRLSGRKALGTGGGDPSRARCGVLSFAAQISNLRALRYSDLEFALICGARFAKGLK